MAALLAGVASGAGVAATDDPSVARARDSAFIRALGPGIETLVARTKPAGWTFEHSCLYYALAGQYLLARHGISSRLHVGTVIYEPYTPYQHRISPHAWLETATYLVDYASLPRRGETSVIPLPLVTHQMGEIKPAITRVLAVRRQPDAQLERYIEKHHACFERALRDPAADHVRYCR